MWIRALFDTAMIAYSLSLTLLFSDVVHPRRKMNRMAVILLFIVFVAMTALLFQRFSEISIFPAYSRSDLLLFIAWLMLTITLVLDTFFRIGLVLFFANVVGFGLTLFAGGLSGRDRMMNLPHGDLLFAHIALATLSEVAFAFAFVFAVMHVVQERHLRMHHFNRWFLQLPSLAALDTWALLSSAFGFFLLLVAMAIGEEWAKLVLHHWIFGVKSIATVITWAMYAVFLFQRVRLGGTGRGLMNYQMACFIATVINLVAIGDATQLPTNR